ncbi:YoaK family protein [Polaromonas sp.]|uniref:YoaK family protein n=1 Tax=Polaromonas sp. TaxID=1869339 RepID=UPI00356A66C4
MLLTFLLQIIASERTRRSNRQFGGILAFVAGAVNAGGFLAVHRYTSHMTGIVSSVADDLVIGSIGLALAGLVSLAAFLAGAITTTLLISWARRQGLRSSYALALLLVFGLVGANLTSFTSLLVPTAVLLLCFIMGLQNAIITKISNAEIRTTHMTGVITDLGLELGRLIYWNHSKKASGIQIVRANTNKLFIHASLLGLFFFGGIAGALAFKTVGFSATLPLALLLVAMALPAIMLDLRKLAQTQ